MKTGVSSDPSRRFDQLSNRAAVAEQKIQENFDAVATSIAQKMGMNEFPWLKWTYKMT